MCLTSGSDSAFPKPSLFSSEFSDRAISCPSRDIVWLAPDVWPAGHSGLVCSFNPVNVCSSVYRAITVKTATLHGYEHVIDTSHPAPNHRLYLREQHRSTSISFSKPGYRSMSLQATTMDQRVHKPCTGNTFGPFCVCWAIGQSAE